MSNIYPYKKENFYQQLKGKIKHQIADSKMNSPLGFVIMGLSAAVIALAVAKFGMLMGLGIIGGLIGITVAMLCMLSTTLGFYLTIIASFFIFFVNRMADDQLPVGLGIDVLIGINFIGIYFKKTIQKERYWLHSMNPITFAYFLYIAFMLVELFNPSMYSVAGWFFSFRKFLNFVMIYFIGLHVFRDLKSVKLFFKVWLSLSALAGLYGCYQHLVGLPSFEYSWVSSDPTRLRLYVQAGVMRVFSFVSDPTAFGILMAASVLFAVVLALGKVTKKSRFLLLAAAFVMALGMGFSGTRTAYAMVPAGLVFYILMTITSRKTLAFAIISLVTFIVLIFGPFHNSTIQRVRSTFEKSDGSYNVRDMNRKRIQPYILSHPLGGGLSTAGVLGEEYNPGHPLAGFPPDSGYLKNAVETGWVGLALNCFIYFIILRVGIRNFYHSRDPEIRGYYAAILASLYALIVAHYSQVAIGQLPGAFFFYSMLPILIKLKTFEENKTNTLNINL